MCELSTQGVRRHEIGKRHLHADLDHRQELAVAALELRVAGDIDLDELEWHLGPNGLEHPPGRGAQVARRGVVEDDSRYGYRPRVIVASATRWTASPYAANRIVVDFAS